jgi:hypothetical protein
MYVSVWRPSVAHIVYQPQARHLSAVRPGPVSASHSLRQYGQGGPGRREPFAVVIERSQCGEHDQRI